MNSLTANPIKGLYIASLGKPVEDMECLSSGEKAFRMMCKTGSIARQEG
jgi:hypothetical protein